MSAWLEVTNAVMALTCERAQIISHAEMPWLTPSFKGTRHILTLRFDGEDACTYGAAFIEELPKHDFAIGRHLVADKKLIWTHAQLTPRQELTVQLELLLLDEAKAA